jgi:hypothetical protein
MDMDALRDDLTDAFVNYQYRLDHPFPSETETPESRRQKYFNDPVFHCKVDSLVAGVLQIVGKHT